MGKEGERLGGETLIRGLDDETLPMLAELMASQANGGEASADEREYFDRLTSERKRRGVIWSAIAGPATVALACAAWLLLANARFVLGGLATAAAVVFGLVFWVQFAEARRRDTGRDDAALEAESVSAGLEGWS
jgi:hypothetical protein